MEEIGNFLTEPYNKEVRMGIGGGKLLNGYFVEDNQTVCCLGERWERTERRLFTSGDFHIRVHVSTFSTPEVVVY